MTLTIEEALKVLREDKELPELPFDVTGKTWETIDDDAWDVMDDYLDKILETKFLGEYLELQVDGGGHAGGPDEWYSEGDCSIDEIYWDWDNRGIYIYVCGPMGYDDKKGSATIKPKDLGLEKNYTLDQLINTIENLTLVELNNIAYEPLSCALD